MYTTDNNKVPYLISLTRYYNPRFYNFNNCFHFQITWMILKNTEQFPKFDKYITVELLFKLESNSINPVAHKIPNMWIPVSS